MGQDSPQRLADSTILNDYPVAVSVRYFSSSNPSGYLTDPSFVANTHDGLWDEMEKIGIAKTDPTLIPDQLVPIDDVQELFASRRNAGIVLERAEFTIYDVKRTEATLGTGVQNTNVNSAITNSLGFVNNLYAQSEVVNAIPVDWNPNWFRPRIHVNGRNIEGGIANTHHAGNKGLQSLGNPTGYEREYAIYYKSIENLDIYARCAQRIRTASGGIFYQPYAVMCTVTFRLHW